MKKDRYLVAIDYDRTLFNTGARSPRGISLKEGYEYAIEKIFGQGGLDCYRSQGGLCNRAPSEVISSLLAQGKYFADVARQRHVWLDSQRRMPSEQNSVSEALTELLVSFKLQLFLDEISENWPEPYSGVADFFQTVTRLREEGGISVSAGILSSGHTTFIEKTFSLWNIPCPEIMVTDDDLRPLKFPERPEERVKPTPFPFHFLVRERWLNQLNGGAPISTSQFQNALKRSLYIGDDPVKDGGLAKNVGVPFGWFRENGKSDPAVSMDLFPKGSFTFSDWSALTDFLKRDSVKEMFHSGIPLAEIFAQF